MPSGYRILTPRELVSADQARREFAMDVLMGLSEHPKQLPSKYFYDDRGSELFRQIMALGEYYPTNCEHEILHTHRGRILELVAGAGPFNLVDLGAGDGAKTRVLLRHFTACGADYRYVPIDISEGAMAALVPAVRAELPGVEVAGLVSGYTDGIAWLGTQAPERRNLSLFLGSNIGNLNRAQARAMLRRLWSASNQDDLVVIGFDLKKDIDVLLDAYNDAMGITAAFNQNLLHRINRELGGHFDVDRFRHFATYNVFSGAMESYLVSLVPQAVRIDELALTFEFREWEPIHTEYSYKYLVSDVQNLAADTGFEIVDQLYDDRRWFLDSVWRVQKLG